MKSGLTLVEVLIAMGISSVVGTLLLVIIVNSSGLFYQQSSKVSQGLTVNDALVTIRSNIKEAGSIAANYPQSGSPLYTSGPLQLVLKIPSIDVSGNIILSTFDYFVFFADQSKLRLKTFPNGLSQRAALDQIFMTNLKNLNFKYLNSAVPPQEVTPEQALKIRVTITAEQKSGAGLESLTATSEAILRND